MTSLAFANQVHSNTDRAFKACGTTSGRRGAYKNTSVPNCGRRHSGERSRSTQNKKKSSIVCFGIGRSLVGLRGFQSSLISVFLSFFFRLAIRIRLQDRFYPKTYREFYSIFLKILYYKRKSIGKMEALVKYRKGLINRGR